MIHFCERIGIDIADVNVSNPKVRMMNNFEDLIGKEYANIAGIAIRKDNHLIYEKYFHGYTQDDALHIASVTKSIISILIGMAIDKGYIKI